MNILVTGASGLIGVALTSHFHEQGHTVYSMSRRDNTAAFYWQPAMGHEWEIRWDECIGIDAVVHLAGESLGNKRWSAAKKQRIYNSRIDTTRALVKKMAKLDNPPKTLISASAIGVYGDCGDREVDESQPPSNDFLANLAKDWESAANQATEYGIRVVNLRTGLVLSTRGGALASMLSPFKMGVGGRLGSGRQWMSWISENDMSRLLTFLLKTSEITGAVNAVSPQPVINADFTRALAQAVNRPAVCHMPALGVKALFGEMGELLLLSSIRVIPARLQALNFEFIDADLTTALASVMAAQR